MLSRGDEAAWRGQALPRMASSMGGGTLRAHMRRRLSGRLLQASAFRMPATAAPTVAAPAVEGKAESDCMSKGGRG